MKLYLIAGGTASGKTTIAQKVWEAVCEHTKINLIQLDDYYHPYSYLKEKYNVQDESEINWDDPITINFDLLKEHLNLLRNGQEVTKSKFVYNTNEYSDEEVVYYPELPTIIEGIHALYDEEISNDAEMKVYVHADSDIRLIRRIRRDAIERVSNFDPNNFLRIWETQIRTMHNKYIEPRKNEADLIISTNNWITRQFNEKIIKIITRSIVN